MRIAICDDIAEDAKALEMIIHQLDDANNWDIVSYTSSSQFLAHICKQELYDIVFLDIDMPEIDGLELGKRIKKVYPNVLIIFATYHPQYVLDAFDLEAFHYILKPFDSKKILSVLQRAHNKYISANKYHYIKIKTQTIRLKIAEIYFIEYCQKHVIYHTSKKDYEVVETLGSVYAVLKDYGFYQIHQGYIVNMEKIDHFNGYSVILTDGRSVAISVRKKTEVITAYTRYIRRQANG